MYLLYLYKEDGIDIDKNPTLIADKSTESAPVGYSRITSIEDIENYCFSLMQGRYKIVRDCIKTLVAEKADPPDVENGFDLCTSAEKAIAAEHNIGTGAQIAATITDLAVRDEYTIDYLTKVKGIPAGVRYRRALWIESLLWSRMKKDLIEISTGVFEPAPEYIYSKMTIGDPDPLKYEISGNLLTLYDETGILGMSEGDQIVGILDYVNSLVGSRYETAGLSTDPKLSALVPSGFNNMTEFKDYISDILNYGLFEIGHEEPAP